MPSWYTIVCDQSMFIRLNILNVDVGLCFRVDAYSPLMSLIIYDLGKTVSSENWIRIRQKLQQNGDFVLN